MGAVLIEGFDPYADISTTGYAVSTIWQTFAGVTVGSSTLVTGRFGGKALSVANNSGGGALLSAAQTSFSFGIAVQFGTLSASTPGIVGWQIGAVAQGYLNLANGFCQIRRGSNTGTVLGTAVIGQLAINTWYYIEVEMVLHASAGTVNVYVNGALVLALTAQNTLNSGTTADTFGFGSNQLNAIGLIVDDIYVRSGSTRFGECRVETLRPDGDDTVAWTPSSGANNFSRVNETLVDGDTSYVSSSTPTQQDLYTVGDLSSTPASIFAVQQRVVGRKDDAGTRTINATVKSSSTTNQGPNVNMAATYSWSNRILDTDPATSAAWTASGVNAVKIGQLEVA